jgi:hypothetical protein
MLREAINIANHTETQATAIIRDRIARAYLQHGVALELALDYNAHLITELREQGIWPARYADPDDFQPAA